MKRVLIPLIGWLFVLAVLLTLVPPDEAVSADPPKAEPPHKNYTETIPGSDVKFDMIAVPGGTFLMGSPEGEKGRGADEGPQHLVTVGPFWMGKCEVTWDEYDIYWKASPGNKEEQRKAEKAGLPLKDFDVLSRPTPPYADETFGYGRAEQPALSMTHHAAMDYCRWLSQKTGKNYRLPTEAEWEWACRAGSKTAYSFGEDPAKLGDYAWFTDNSEDVPNKVGKKKPNAWGLHDMHGNVWEWCLDHYDKEFYGKFAKDKATVMPVNLPTADRYPHVARGGSWADKPPSLRSAARRASDKSWNRQDPQQPKSIWWLTEADYLGFRIVCGVADPKELKGIRSKVKWDSK